MPALRASSKSSAVTICLKNPQKTMAILPRVIYRLVYLVEGVLKQIVVAMAQHAAE